MMVLASVATLAILGKATSALWPFEEQAKLKKVDEAIPGDKYLVDPLGFWILNGKRLDLTKFMDQHPGGRRVVSWTKGRDISELVLMYHSLSLLPIEQMAEKFLHPDQSDIPRRKELLTSEFYPTLSKRIREFYAAKGIWSSHKMPLKMLIFRCFFLVPLLLFAGWRWLNGSWWACFAVGP